jgi:hypothetical protein
MWLWGGVLYIRMSSLMFLRSLRGPSMQKARPCAQSSEEDALQRSRLAVSADGHRPVVHEFRPDGPLTLSPGFWALDETILIAAAVIHMGPQIMKVTIQRRVLYDK